MQPCSQASFGRVVERRGFQPGGQESGLDNRDPGPVQRGVGSLDDDAVQAAETVGRLPARTAAPSIGAGPTWTTTLPGRTPPVATKPSASASPSIWPTAIGRATASVTSVWPPTR